MFIYIMITVTFSSVTLLMYYFYSKTLDYKNGEVMLLKIPYVNKDDKEVLEIVEKAKKLLKIVSIIQLILILLLNFMIWFNLSYMGVFIAVLLVPIAIEALCLNSQRKKLLLLKYENNWGSKADVFIDTRLLNSNLKSKYNKIYIYSMLFFLILIVINILVLKTEMLSSVLMITPILLITVFFMTMKAENYVYISEDFEKNYDYNLNKINENVNLFKQVILINIFIAMLQVLGIYLLVNKIKLFFIFIFISMFLSFIVMIIYMIKYYKINKKYETNKNSIVNSGDFYDYISYDNPYDNRIFVADKVQMGMTINRGNSKGKIVFIGTYVLVIAIFVVLFSLMNLSKQSDYKYTVENKVLEIDSFGYDTKVDLRKTEGIELKEFKKFPDAFKNNGVGDNKKSYGNWKVEGYGDVKLYINNDVNYYIIIKTKDQNYIFNDTSIEKTKNLYSTIVLEIEN
ncbi:hypothetical protein [Miniphocaeibacter massiliensis]|uniref:hypothetical protein n=1 Tax=Miniphocaeibacter massiliensis TaxID=2041841 RepID=UPI000C0689DA|nr:hypothetical protein [Miniphocaeibacter massiliensis]